MQSPHHIYNFSEQPISLRISHRASQLTSNAFLASTKQSCREILYSNYLFWNYLILMILKIQTPEYLEKRKPHWESDTLFGTMKLFSRSKGMRASTSPTTDISEIPRKLSHRTLNTSVCKESQMASTQSWCTSSVLQQQYINIFKSPSILIPTQIPIDPGDYYSA